MASDPRILLVEDDPANALTLGVLLEEEGYAVEVVGSCAAALGALSAGRDFEAILVDRGLPDGDGLSIAGVARQRQPRATVISLSGADLADGDRARVDAVIAKGAPIEAIVAAIRAHR